MRSLILGCAAALVLTALPVRAQQSSTENIAFKWAFGAMVGKDKKFVSVTKDTILKTGDEIKMLVELTKECYIYVVHYGSKGEVDLLFPYSTKQFTEDYETGRNYYIPRGRAWIQLDKNTGKEVFFLVASVDRMIALEGMLAEYQTANAMRKEALSKDIVQEIREVRKRYKSYATLAEKPLTIGGNIRGVAKAEEARRPDVANIVTQISANNFYSKTFTIEHQ